MIVGVDIDDVLLPLTPEWLRRYREQTGHALHPEDLTSWHVASQMPTEHRVRGMAILMSPDLYERIEPYERANEGVELLRRMGRVVFVTSCPNLAAAKHKYDWLQRWGFFPDRGDHRADFVVAHDKGLVMVDALVDDGPHNIAAHVRDGAGIGFLVRRPHNRNVVLDIDDGFVVAGVHEVPSLVEKLWNDNRPVAV